MNNFLIQAIFNIFNVFIERIPVCSANLLKHELALPTYLPPPFITNNKGLCASTNQINTTPDSQKILRSTNWWEFYV
jgi:hypothetical protein